MEQQNPKTVSRVNFNMKDRPEFIKELRKNVNAYFEENGISKYGNINMKLKTVFMITLYTTPLVLMLTGAVSSSLTVLSMWFLMSLGMAGIGLSVMHDGNHGSYSKNRRINSFMGFLSNIVGGYHVNWKIQHNVLHHTFTNIEDYDEDFDIDVMRLSPSQKRKSFYRFQAFYAPFIYGLMTLNWLIYKDFNQLVRYHKKNLLIRQGLTVAKATTHVLFYKLAYIGIIFVMPMIFIQLPWYEIVLGFLMMHFICGIILALIFQPAHVINETEYFKVDEDCSVENHWAIHQLYTTANFANRKSFFSWFIGGLNHQIEHHLFPHISHVHYRKIAPIIKATAKKYGLPYYQHRTFFDALKSHFSLVHRLGTGSYDQTMAAAA